MAKNLTGQVPPMPQKSPIADKTGMLTDAWNRWLLIFFGQLQNEQLGQGRQL